MHTQFMTSHDTDVHPSMLHENAMHRRDDRGGGQTGWRMMFSTQEQIPVSEHINM